MIFVIILKFIFTPIFEIKIYGKNCLTLNCHLYYNKKFSGINDNETEVILKIAKLSTRINRSRPVQIWLFLVSDSAFYN